MSNERREKTEAELIQKDLKQKVIDMDKYNSGKRQGEKHKFTGTDIVRKLQDFDRTGRNSLILETKIIQIYMSSDLVFVMRLIRLIYERVLVPQDLLKQFCSLL